MWYNLAMKRLLGFLLTFAALFVALLAISGSMAAQSKLAPATQVAGTAPVAVEWGVCNASGTTPDGRNWDCTGIELMRFRYKDGTQKVMVMVVASPEMEKSTRFVRVPIN